MNLTDPEHISAVRQSLADGLTECWLVVEGDASATRLVVFRAPRRWVALTGACERCGGSGAVGSRDDALDCPADCIDGRKRATLTVESWSGSHPHEGVRSYVPLAVATVEVLPVHKDALLPWITDLPDRVVTITTWGEVALVTRTDRTLITLHRQPVPGKDYVIHLTNLEPA